VAAGARNWLSYVGASSATHALTVPVCRAGDLLLASISAQRQTGDTVTLPSGWTLVHDEVPAVLNVGMNVSYRIATSADISGSVTYTWTLSTARPVAGAIVVMQGADQATPIHIHTAQSGGGHSVYVTAPAGTRTIRHTSYVLFGAGNGNNTFLPPGYRFHMYDRGTNTGANDVCITAAYESAQGTTGAQTPLTLTMSASDDNCGVCVWLVPDGSEYFTPGVLEDINLSTDFEGGIDAIHAQWSQGTAWEDGWVQQYFEHDIQFVNDPTAHSGDWYVQFPITGNADMELMIPFYPMVWSLSFYLRIPEPLATGWDSFMWDEYVVSEAVYLTGADDPDYPDMVEFEFDERDSADPEHEDDWVTIYVPRPDDWTKFEFKFDARTGMREVWVGGEQVYLGHFSFYFPLTPYYEWEVMLWEMSIVYDIDDLEFTYEKGWAFQEDLEDSTSSWRYPRKFCWCVGDNLWDGCWPSPLLTEGDNHYMNFTDINGHNIYFEGPIPAYVDKSLQTGAIETFSFDFRVESAGDPGDDQAIAKCYLEGCPSYYIDAEIDGNGNSYSPATYLFRLAYDGTSDSFYVDEGLPCLSTGAAISFARTGAWRTFKVVADIVNDTLEYYLDGATIGSHTIARPHDFISDYYHSDPVYYEYMSWQWYWLDWGQLSITWSSPSDYTINETNVVFFDIDNIFAYSDSRTLSQLSQEPFALQTAIIEMDWPRNGTWTEETSNAFLGVNYSYGIISPGGSLSQLGEGPVAQMSLRMDNSDGRFSVDRTGSQAQVNGIFQTPIRFSPGYYDSGGTPQRAVVFLGRVQDVQEDEASATATLSCQGYDFDIQQQRPETLTQTDHRTDELIADVATDIAFTGTSLDRGYTVVPYHYADADDGLAEMREIAESEAGIVWVNPKTGNLEFWAWAKWIGAASEATYTRTLLENVRPRHDYRQAFDVVNVTYQPRRTGRLMNLHQLGTPILIAPLCTKTLTIRFHYPIAEYDSYEVVATTSGGVGFTEGVELTVSNADDSTPWVPEGAVSSRVKFANASANHGMVIRKFDVLGRPIEGLPNREYKADKNYLVVHRRTDVKPNEVKARACLQHEAQAALVAELKAYRLQDPPVLLTVGPLPGNPELNVGSAITVNIAAGISQINKLVILLHRQGSYALRYEETWLAIPQDELYQYATVSTGTTAGAFKVGTSRLSYGRLGF